VGRQKAKNLNTTPSADSAVPIVCRCRTKPRLPRIADPLFLAHYIEKAGTGTLEMIDQCLTQGLPEPVFREQGDQFVLTLWRDWLTPDLLARLNVSSRQSAGLAHVKVRGRITNREYQDLVGVGERTALRDLGELVSKGILERVGGTGRGAYYVLGRKPVTHQTNTP